MMVLPDVLQAGLRVVFCGTAASRRSAAGGAYYAHPGNRFWRALHQVGLTPIQLRPEQFQQVLHYGIGLTDLNKVQSGVDAELDPAAFDRAGLTEKLLRYRPAALAFTSMHGAQSYFRRKLAFGRQIEPVGDTIVWVLPSPSGSARPHWERLKHHWHHLADYLKSLQ